MTFQVEPPTSTTGFSFDVVGGDVGPLSYQPPPSFNPITRQIDIPPVTEGDPPVAGGPLRFAVTSAPVQDATDARAFSVDLATTVELLPDGVSVERLEQLAREEGIDLAFSVACARVVLATGGEVVIPGNAIRYFSEGGRVVGAVRISSRITGVRVGRGNGAIPSAPVNGSYVVAIRSV